MWNIEKDVQYFLKKEFPNVFYLVMHNHNVLGYSKRMSTCLWMRADIHTYMQILTLHIIFLL